MVAATTSVSSASTALLAVNAGSIVALFISILLCQSVGHDHDDRGCGVLSQVDDPPGRLCPVEAKVPSFAPRTRLCDCLRRRFSPASTPAARSGWRVRPTTRRGEARRVPSSRAIGSTSRHRDAEQQPETDRRNGSRCSSSRALPGHLVVLRHAKALSTSAKHDGHEGGAGQRRPGHGRLGTGHPGSTLRRPVGRGTRPVDRRASSGPSSPNARRATVWSSRRPVSACGRARSKTAVRHRGPPPT